ncbi:uncharacterized protein TNCV_2268021 [Trichonephila clavipes]|nr:uncharacterized protein TNCV_2268021 [Trichonephila clavipes]
MVSWDYLWPTLRCRREAGVSPLLSIGWWYLSSESPKGHCCRVSAADKGCRVYPLDPRPDAVALYSGCTSVISEPDLLTTSDAEILEGFSSQGVIQVRRITLKKDTTLIPTKHLILTFSSPTLPQSIKAGYLNCKIRPYIPNPLRCFKCQRFGHSQTACRGQLTCSRCASVGHSSADCSLAQKCVNCSQPHSSDSKQCPKWKAEKEIQAIKTNRNISYLEARKLIAPQFSQTYAQVAKPSTVTSTTQTDENITHIKCPPLQLLQPLLSVPQPDKSNSVSALSSATQADLLSSTSSNAPSTNDMFTSIGTSSPIITTSSSHSVIQPPSASNIQDTKKISKVRARKRKKKY